MEWTGRQQIIFLLQSIGLGATIGLFLDGLATLMLRRVRQNQFILDVALGGVTALLVFFGSLVILDGQLHPLLLFGSTAGMVVEHLVVGLWIRKWLMRMRRVCHKIWRSTVERTMNAVRNFPFRQKNSKK